MERRQFPAFMDGTHRIHITCSGTYGVHKAGKTIGVFGWCPPLAPLNDGRQIGNWLGNGPGISYRYPEAEFDEPGETREVYHEVWNLACKQCRKAGHGGTVSIRGLNRRKSDEWSTLDLLLWSLVEAGIESTDLQHIEKFLSSLPPREEREIKFSEIPKAPEGTVASWEQWKYYGFPN